MPAADARRQLAYELLSGASGVALAAFMWGHMVLVGSILTGRRGFDWMATILEDYYIAQPTVIAIFALFLLHAVLASRKIPAQLAERKRVLSLSRDLASPAGVRPPGGGASPHPPHVESLLWIWQVRTGMIVLVLGSFHILLLGVDVLTPLFGERHGIEAVTSVDRVRGGLWLVYAVLLVAVEFHASVGLYRFAVKWWSGSLPSRRIMRLIEHLILWFFLGLGFLVLLVLAEVLDPPLAFLLADTSP